MNLASETSSHHRYAALLELSDELSSALDPGEVAAVALAVIVRATGVHEGTISMCDWRRGELISLARQGPFSARLAAHNATIPLSDDRAAVHVIRHGRPYQCDDITTAPDLPAVTRAVMTGVGASSLLCVPLTVKHEVVGALTLMHGRPRSYTPGEISFVTALAHQTALALDRAGKFSAAQRRATRLATLSEIQQAIATHLSRPDLYATVARQTVRVLEGSAFQVCLLAGAPSVLTCPFASRDDVALIEPAPPPIPLDASACERAIATGYVAVDDDADGADGCVRSLIAAPLVQADRVFGLLCVGSRSPAAYVPEDAQLLQTIAAQTASALETIGLYDEARRQAAERSAILDNLAEGLTIASGDGEIRLINPAGARLWGIPATPPGARLSPHDHELFEPRFPNGSPVLAHQWPLARALHGEHFADYELVIHAADGVRRHLSFSGGPVPGLQGEPALAVTIYRDVTALREVERLKDEFVSLISHELRGPLTAISGFTQLLARRLGPGADELTRADLGEVHAATDRLQGLIDDLTDMARLETGRLRLATRPCDLVATIRRAAQAATGFDDLPISISADVDVANVLADPRRLEQVLTNLLSNARKYGDGAEPITVAFAPHPDGVVVSVRDRGMGIEPADLAHVFDRFFRAPTALSADGSGLGLYIAKMLVEAHDGHIWVESAPGQGSTFHFTLPCAHDPATLTVSERLAPHHP